ncbi:unnamed protein product [Pleuronectes platessa]|uniref:Uncharacterized protein n=1 Tax=Pleuronectes platessa TaxID=8262 RepID=A0A9N7VEK9_PLEPL|nr:unnamed protein product [Pleuronectes platessa]
MVFLSPARGAHVPEQVAWLVGDILYSLFLLQERVQVHFTFLLCTGEGGGGGGGGRLGRFLLRGNASIMCIYLQVHILPCPSEFETLYPTMRQEGKKHDGAGTLEVRQS